VDEDFCDLARLIRSIQRLEGNLDCFGAAGDFCEQTLCAWRGYCLKPQDESDSSKADLQKGVLWKND
jgi:hypothetical protein